jgi:hypothetical protein
MANIANPRKQFNFSIFALGLEPFLAQKVTIPEESIDVVEHGDTNYDVKTGGRKKIGALTIEKIMAGTGADNWVETWMSTIQNEFLGGGFLPSVYKQTLVIYEFATDGVVVINKTTCYGCWPSKRNGIELNRRGSDNTLQSIEFQVDQVQKS